MWESENQDESPLMTTDNFHGIDRLDSVPSLLKDADFERDGVTGRVKAFYEENPFPNYEGVEEFSSLDDRFHESCQLS